MAHNNERVALTPEALLAGCARLHAEGAGRFALEIHRAATSPRCAPRPLPATPGQPQPSPRSMILSSAVARSSACIALALWRVGPPRSSWCARCVPMRERHWPSASAAAAPAAAPIALWRCWRCRRCVKYSRTCTRSLRRRQMCMTEKAILGRAFWVSTANQGK